LAGATSYNANNLLFVSPPNGGASSKITLLSERRGGVRLFTKKAEEEVVEKSPLPRTNFHLPFIIYNLSFSLREVTPYRN